MRLGRHVLRVVARPQSAARAWLPVPFQARHLSSAPPIVAETPIVAALWQQRRDEEADAAASAGTDPNAPRAPSVARRSVNYNFKEDVVLRSKYENPWGGIRLGRLLQDLDTMAGTIAHAHCVHGSRKLHIVTASVDRIVTRGKSPSLDEECTLSGVVTWVGKSSMEISMAVQATSEVELAATPWLTANFTFVARHGAGHPEEGRAASIPPLSPETAAERVLFESGAQRAVMKKQMRKAPPPTIKENAVHELLEKAHSQRLLASLADPSLMLMKDTELHNTLTCQPQHQNTAGRVFGGFLMRRAFELAFANAYTFAGAKPAFLEVDEIQFKKPVNIGDLLKFTSSVLYTEAETEDQCGEVHVDVSSYILKPEDKQVTICNSYNFTFAVPRGCTLKQILPSNEEEARSMVLMKEVNWQQEHGDL